MNDLLTDSFVSGSREHPAGDVEMGLRPQPSGTDLAMEAFFKQVKELEKQMDKLNQLLAKLQDRLPLRQHSNPDNKFDSIIKEENANEESKSVTKASTMKAIKQRMAKDIDEVGKIARKIKEKLDEIDKDNLANRQKPGCEAGTGVDRSRTAMTNSLKKKLKERMTDFQILRQNIQNEYREVVERRVFTVTGSRPDDETIDQLIETGNSEQIFHKAIQEMGRREVLATVEEIQERHDAVQEIEKKLLDLHQVFLDMAVLVEAQGDLLDNIETQVTNAVGHVQSGNDALITAKSLQKKSRKCMMIAIIMLLIIAIIVVLSILKPWSKK